MPELSTNTSSQQIICFSSSEHLQAVKCVVDHLEYEYARECDYNSVFSAVWEANYNSNIVDVLRMSQFPGADCAGNVLFDL